MKSSLTMCGQYSALMSGSTVGQRMGSKTTSFSWLRPDHSMNLAHSGWPGRNGSVAMNQGCISLHLIVDWFVAIELHRKRASSAGSLPEVVRVAVKVGQRNESADHVHSASFLR